MPRLTLRDWVDGLRKLASAGLYVWQFEYGHCLFVIANMDKLFLIIEPFI